MMLCFSPSLVVTKTTGPGSISVNALLIFIRCMTACVLCSLPDLSLGCIPWRILVHQFTNEPIGAGSRAKPFCGFAAGGSITGRRSEVDARGEGSRRGRGACRGGAGCQNSLASHLPERPVRVLPSGSLRKFSRGLGQFPLSFSAEPRRGPAPPVKSLRFPTSRWRTWIGESNTKNAHLGTPRVRAVREAIRKVACPLFFFLVIGMVNGRPQGQPAYSQKFP